MARGTDDVEVEAFFGDAGDVGLPDAVRRDGLVADGTVPLCGADVGPGLGVGCWAGEARGVGEGDAEEEVLVEGGDVAAEVGAVEGLDLRGGGRCGHSGEEEGGEESHRDGFDEVCGDVGLVNASGTERGGKLNRYLPS